MTAHLLIKTCCRDLCGDIHSVSIKQRPSTDYLGSVPNDEAKPKQAKLQTQSERSKAGMRRGVENAVRNMDVVQNRNLYKTVVQRETSK